jgi:hypothetical protein
MVEIQERVSNDIDAVAVRALVASSRSQVQAVTTPEFSRRRLMMPVMLIPMFFRIDLHVGRTGHTMHRRIRRSALGS